MKIRTQLHSITSDIENFLKQEDQQNIYLTPLQGWVDLSRLPHIICTKATQYDEVEKSLTGRLKTFENLSKSLRELAYKVGGATHSWIQKIRIYIGVYLFSSFLNPTEKSLWETIQRIENLRDKEDRSYIESPMVQFNEQTQIVSLTNHLHRSENELAGKIKICAFRTLKNIDAWNSFFIDPKVQGQCQVTSIRTIQKDLQQFLALRIDILSDDQKKEIESLLVRLKYLESITYESYFLAYMSLFSYPSPKYMETKIANLSYSIEQNIEKLNVGQSLVLPGGYLDRKGGGHAVIFEIQRMDEANFQFVIYNTGLGCELGLSFWQSVKKTWSSRTPPISFQKLSLDSISNQKFLMSIISFNVKPTTEYDQMEKLFSMIQKHCIQEGGIQGFLNGHPIQSWGTCAFDSIMAYIQQKLSPALFQKFEAYMAVKARQELEQLLPEAKSKQVFNNYTIELIDKKSAEFSRRMAANL